MFIPQGTETTETATTSEQFITNLENMSDEEVAANFKNLFTQALSIEEQEKQEGKTE